MSGLLLVGSSRELSDLAQLVEDAGHEPSCVRDWPRALERLAERQPGAILLELAPAAGLAQVRAASAPSTRLLIRSEQALDPVQRAGLERLGADEILEGALTLEELSERMLAAAASAGAPDVATASSAKPRPTAFSPEALAQALAEVLQATSDFVGVAAPDGQVLHVNRAGRLLIGLDESYDVTRLRIDDFYPPDFARRLRDEILAEVAGRGSWRGAGELLHHEGVRIPVSQAILAHRDAAGRFLWFSTIARDEAEPERLRAELQLSEERYRSFVEHSGEGIYLFEFREPFLIDAPEDEQIAACYRNGYIAACNDVFARMYGHASAATMAGTSLLEAHGTADNPENIAFLRAWIRSGYRIRDAVSEELDREGNRVFFSNNVIGIVEKGRLLRAWASQQDVTVQREAEEALQRAHGELELRVEERTAELTREKQRAEAADRMKTAFLSSMSHELRTPLTSIIGYAGVLQQGLVGPLNAEQADQLSKIRQSAGVLLALINDVLDLSKLEAGELDLAPAELDPGRLLSELLEESRPGAEAKGLRLLLDEEAPDAGSRGPAVFGDPVRLRQVLHELLDNAVKFTSAGEVRLRLVPAEGELVVEIGDTGPGIPAEHVQRMFEPFRQGDRGHSRRHEGTGLGLAISRRLCELMGGRLEVESEAGRGSTFRVRLPLRGAEDDAEL